MISAWTNTTATSVSFRTVRWVDNCKVIALCNQKGGVGKTTSAENLGIGLATQGKRVLLIDADAQASLTLALGYGKPDDLDYTLSDALMDVINDEQPDTSKGILHQEEGVDLLPANITLSAMDMQLINTMSRETVLRSYINAQRRNYDYILIDCMPSLGLLTVNALSTADSVVIPTQPQFLSAKGLEQLLRTISKVKRQVNPPLRIDGIVLTMVDSRSTFTKEITQLIRGQYGANVRVFQSEIPRSIRAVEATAEGKSIFAYDKSGKVAEAYRNLTQEVINIEKQREKGRIGILR